jgi:hypothetical protein
MPKGKRRVKAPLGGGQGSKGAVVPCVEAGIKKFVPQNVDIINKLPENVYTKIQ